LPPPNLIANPSFEGDLAGWSTYDSSITRLALGAAPDGDYVAKVAYTGGSGYSIQDLGAVAATNPGTTYTATAYVEAASPSAIGKTIWISIREYNSGGHAFFAQDGTAVTLTSSFQEISVTYVTTQTNGSVGIYVLQNPATAGDAFYVDKVSLTR
jgi:hypothetical protein